jgi:hypothetical protein
MILEYVDDSGDDGLVNSPTRFFVLSTILIYEESWKDVFREIKSFRGFLRREYGIKLNQELKSNYLVRNSGYIHELHLSEDERVKIYQECLSFLASIDKIRLFSVCIRKREIAGAPIDIYEFAWTLLLTRLHYTANRMNGNNRKDTAILISDETNETKLRSILRKLRVYNPIKSKNVPLTTFIEDPFIRESTNSHFVQFCDLVAFAVAAKDVSSKILRPYKFGDMYAVLDPILEKSVHDGEQREGIVYYPKK